MKPALRQHFTRFIDRHYHPDYQPDDVAWEIFSRIQSHGHRAVTEDERRVVAPLIDAQQNKEITIKTLAAEMAEWWCMRVGWAWPMAATIRHEVEAEHVDGVYLRALLNIDASCGGGISGYPEIWELVKSRAPGAARMWEDRVRTTAGTSLSFIDFLLGYSGFPEDQRQRYLTWRFGPPHETLHSSSAP